MLQGLESIDDIARGDRAIDSGMVDRILNTPVFLRSARLSGFLQYVCGEMTAGRGDELNEQQIGIAVFGRNPDYDSTVDSIVRSHATRLRQKLREYFETAGVDEPYILTMPKGGYIPRMEARPDAGAGRGPEETFSTDALTASLIPPLDPVELPAQRTDQKLPPSAVPAAMRRKLWALQGLCLALALLAVVLGTLLWRGSRLKPRPSHPLWSGFLDAHRGRTIIVQSDSGLVLYQHLSKHPVALSEYIGEGYGKDLSSENEEEALASRMARKRYTPVLDSLVYEHFSKYLDPASDNVTTRFARDLRLDELKRNNAVLLGSHESNPWVSLFEPGMNFLFQSDLKDGLATIHNRRPKPGEEPEYTMRKDDPDHIVYGLLAYRPNLTHTGDVLIVEGQTMAGTQSSLDYLFNDAQLLPFLESIKGSERSIPHFEVLLRSSSVAGQSSRIEAVAYRVERD